MSDERAFSRRHAPFDTTRGGFVLGEGAFRLWLERADAAAPRERAHGEILGVGASSAAVPLNAWPDAARRARAHDAARARGCRPERRRRRRGLRVSERHARARRGRSGGVDDAVRRHAATVVTSIKGALGESARRGRRGVRRGVAVRRASGRVPPIAGLVDADRGGRARCGSRATRSTRPDRSRSSTASRAAARCSASCCASRDGLKRLHGRSNRSRRVTIVAAWTDPARRQISAANARRSTEREPRRPRRRRHRRLARHRPQHRRALAAAGAAVGVMFQEREEPAREFEAGVRARGGRAWAGQCDVGDEAVGRRVLRARGRGARTDRHPREQRRHHPRRARHVPRPRAVGRGAERQPRRARTSASRRRARHAAAALGTDHQRVVAERAAAAGRAGRATRRRRPGSKG